LAVAWGLLIKLVLLLLDLEHRFRVDAGEVLWIKLAGFRGFNDALGV
jgi:hypothetical protein